LEVKVGTCGWSVKGGKGAYYRTFHVIELQETFYKLPKVETVERWRSEAPEGFEFVVKAWQALTHPAGSPTWRRVGGPPRWGRVEGFGHLRPTEENFKAWEKVLGICRALGSRIIIIQTPPSFGYSEENIANVRGFISSVERKGLLLGWEPRGTWNQHQRETASLCQGLSLMHVMDPFRRPPFTETNTVYFRLHGIGKGETSYSYRYTNGDLKNLLSIVENQGAREVYVMFNNVTMAEDALKFKDLLERSAHGL
jgi:uncharacterized protein YecE (DUF72 family)